MRHDFHTPLQVIRVTGQQDGDFTIRKPDVVGEYKCVVVSTSSSSKTHEKPIIWTITKKIGLPSTTDIQRSDEVLIQEERFLVIDVTPHRYSSFKKFRATLDNDKDGRGIFIGAVKEYLAIRAVQKAIGADYRFDEDSSKTSAFDYAYCKLKVQPLDSIEAFYID
ncbi:hypothetical protein QE450_004196 [Paenibacillus sp. SORGH_AS306]|nr:hypothetical protein [Paenibacillus sp. SORGH_AS_0306]MDR6109055.1 hypothetical protein [Paenibacillus sp. SORGH_AS_0338]